MEFDAATQSLKCPHCGEEQKIDANRSAVREHKLTAEARQMVRVQDKKSTTMQCPSCGAMVEVEPNSTAKDCPYCGTAFVLAEKQTDVIVPDHPSALRLPEYGCGCHAAGNTPDPAHSHR